MAQQSPTKTQDIVLKVYIPVCAAETQTNALRRLDSELRSSYQFALTVSPWHIGSFIPLTRASAINTSGFQHKRISAWIWIECFISRRVGFEWGRGIFPTTPPKAHIKLRTMRLWNMNVQLQLVRLCLEDIKPSQNVRQAPFEAEHAGDPKKWHVNIC